MKVMVYLGSKATARVIQGLKSMSDDIDYVAYTSVANFVQESETRHLSFARVVFNNKFVPNGEDDYIRLNEFIHTFSSGTELVMVINDGDKVSEDLFNKYFSSPMHSCALVKNSASMDFFRDIVSLPISDVKARYYTLDKNSGGVVTAKSVESKMSGFKGGAKKSAESVDSSAPQSIVSEPASKTESFGSDFSSGFGEENPVKPVSKPESFTSGEDFSSSDFEEGSGFSSDVRTSPEPSSSSDEDFVEDDEDDILSVGDFGSRHSDTDMFDEEEDSDELSEEPAGSSVDEAERQRLAELEEQNRLAAQIQEEERRRAAEAAEAAKKQAQKSVESKKPVEHTRNTPKSWNTLKGTPYQAYNVNFIISAEGSMSAQQVVDDTVRMMEAGMRVLIVDMDFVHNGVLSFIDTEKYYSGNNNAYAGGNIFVEEKIGVYSGGYGFIPDKSEIANVFSGKVISGYDIVIVDCPVSSLRYVNSDLLEKANVIVFSDSDPSQIVVTSLAITDRNVCTLEQERVIMGGKYILAGDKEDLAKETVSQMFFANGCWLK